MPQASNTSSSSTGTAANEQQIISLVDIIQIVRKRLKYGLLVAVIVLLPLAIIYFGKRDMYQASSTMMIELTPQNVMNFTEVVETGVANPNLLQTFMNLNVERVKTRAMAEAVIASLSEEEVKAFVEGYLGPLEERPSDAPEPDPVGLLMSKDALEVERGEDDDSQTLRVIITHYDPNIAQVLANRYAEQYVIYKAGLRSDSTVEAAAFLKVKVDNMRAELGQAEMELQDYRQKNNLVSLQQDQGIIVERLMQLNEALTQKRLDLIDADGRITQIDAAGTELSRLMEIPFIGGREDINEVYRQLNELRLEREVLDETYLSRHPKIIDNQASIKSVEAVLTRVVSQALKQVRSEKDALDAEVKSLETKLEAAEQHVLATERALIEYNHMERDVQNMREIFDRLATRYNETSIAKDIDINVVRILDRAQLPTSPTSVSLIQVVAILGVVGGLCVVGVPLGIELLDNRLASFADIENFSGKPLLGDLRAFTKKSSKEISTAVLNRDSDLIEPFRAIFSAIRLRSNISKEKISFVVTSSLPDEGKSSVAANLASIIASHDYSVLLVDCDFRRPSLHLAYDMQNDRGLLRWYEKGKPTIDSSSVLSNEDLGIVELGDNLYFLRSGGVSELPTEVFGDRKMDSLFESLKENFDVVIIDTPPVGIFPDATLVGDNVDHCIFVARQFKVNRQKVRYSINLMDRSQAEVLGVVFNGIKDVNAAVGYGNNASTYYGHGFEKDARKYAKYYSQQRT